ncbi:N-alpha-acetyltransferase 30 [Callorhinchus milii]|uniref:N-alpha-acetyltransferase 30 n=1 Tax=Callorhinchus milii TaxID=7868 RepID=UPI001C3FA88C|nr:N-alpha-acetyltransferase 30 [Callorhinchus milii]
MSDLPPGPSVVSPSTAALNHSGAYQPLVGGPGPQGAAYAGTAGQGCAEEERPEPGAHLITYPETSRGKKGVPHPHRPPPPPQQQQQQRLLNGCVAELHYKADRRGRLSCAEGDAELKAALVGLSPPEGRRKKAEAKHDENQRTAEVSGPGPEHPADGIERRLGVSPEDEEEEEHQQRLAASVAACSLQEADSIRYVGYQSELQMPDIMRLITKDLSEPYSIYTYRYFIHNWPQLCFLAMVEDECVGAIVCKLDMHKKMFRRGYIAMLAVDSKYRRKCIGTNLVKKAIYAMVEGDCDEVVLETEITNKSALKLYENLGFVRDKRLFRYYLNGVDALRLKLWLR